MAILKDMTVVPDDYIVKHIKTNIATSQYRDGTVVYAVEKEYVPLVRCKYCKRYESDGGALMTCTLNDMITDDDCFCWWGERKEE